MSENLNPKIPLIIDCTLDILRDGGEQGVSMRKVAAKAGMSLGNLQYYFKSKDELFAGVIREYFGRCSGHFNAALAERRPEGRLETIRFLVEYGMDYADSEIAKVFRELWGIAARNRSVENHLHEYYRAYADALVEMLVPYAKTPAAASTVASFLIPFYEGYGMISSPLPSDRREMAEGLVRMVDALLDGDFAWT